MESPPSGQTLTPALAHAPRNAALTAGGAGSWVVWTGAEDAGRGASLDKGPVVGVRVGLELKGWRPVGRDEPIVQGLYRQCDGQCGVRRL